MNTGSSYETYDKTHKNYDLTRLAIGNEQLVQMLGNFAEPALRPSLRVLDAGCGTGVHLAAFEAAGFTNLTGLDASATGLAASKAKLKSEARLVLGDIRQMPFAEASFDLILFSFVIHHLPHQNGKELKAATTGMLDKASKLLAPGGKMAIITCTPEQLHPDRGCLWYYKYFPQAAKALAARFLPVRYLRSALRSSGLSRLSVVPVDQTYWTEASLDARGPFDRAWRSGDSLFALAEKDKAIFAEQLRKLETDTASGALQEHIAETRERADVVKQAVIILASK
jgi:ubiquinone/menaquinone biosynthesis C-methylase UbiE